MSILRETKWALLELFPEQKATEAETEKAAREKHRADAKAKIEAEIKAKAEAEAKAKAKSEAKEGEGTAGEAVARKPTPTETTAAESASIDLAAKVKSQAISQTAHPEEPESDEPPVSLEPEGPRPHGVMVRNYAARGYHLDVFCAPDQVVAAAQILDGAGFSLEAVTGVDWIKEDQLEVVYDYTITDGRLCRVAVRTRIPRSAPEVPTISHICPGANWHERETHDFYGIKFTGHPYLVPLLLPEDADFHPLLKDFTP